MGRDVPNQWLISTQAEERKAEDLARKVDAESLETMRSALSEHEVHATKIQKTLGLPTHRKIHIAEDHQESLAVSKIRHGLPDPKKQLLVPYADITHVAPIDPVKPHKVIFTHTVAPPPHATHFFSPRKARERTHVLTCAKEKGAENITFGLAALVRHRQLEERDELLKRGGAAAPDGGSLPGAPPPPSGANKASRSLDRERSRKRRGRHDSRERARAHRAHMHMASALNVRDATRAAGDGRFKDVAIPAPPCGFLSSALVERDAWFESHRTKIVGHIDDPDAAVSFVQDAEELVKEMEADAPRFRGPRGFSGYMPQNFLPNLPPIRVPESVALKAEQLKARALAKLPHYRRRMPKAPPKAA